LSAAATGIKPVKEQMENKANSNDGVALYFIFIPQLRLWVRLELIDTKNIRFFFDVNKAVCRSCLFQH
jgi:hypothetical protein